MCLLPDSEVMLSIYQKMIVHDQKGLQAAKNKGAIKWKRQREWERTLPLDTYHIMKVGVSFYNDSKENSGCGQVEVALWL